MMMSFTESAKNLSVDELIKVVLRESGYLKMLRANPEDGKQENISREENLGEFVDSAKEFTERNPEGTLQDFLNHIALITDLDTVDEEEARVKLMTVHTAKGLEFPVVFVVGMEERIFPHANSLGIEAELEEERRACYVAFTRAKKKLYITAAQERMFFGKIKDQDISRFVKEIPVSCIEGNLPASSSKKSSPFKPKSTYRAPTAFRPAQIIHVEKKPEPPADFHVGEQINHKMWGLGTIMAVDSKDIVVSFTNPEIGVRTLGKKVAPVKKI